jgi:hypothetical protein
MSGATGEVESGGQAKEGVVPFQGWEEQGLGQQCSDSHAFWTVLTRPSSTHSVLLASGVYSVQENSYLEA